GIPAGLVGAGAGIVAYGVMTGQWEFNPAALIGGVGGGLIGGVHGVLGHAQSHLSAGGLHLDDPPPAYGDGSTPYSDTKISDPPTRPGSGGSGGFVSEKNDGTASFGTNDSTHNETSTNGNGDTRNGASDITGSRDNTPTNGNTRNGASDIGDTRDGTPAIGNNRNNASANDSTRQDIQADNDSRNGASTNGSSRNRTARNGSSEITGSRNAASTNGDTRNGASNVDGSRNDTSRIGATAGNATTRSGASNIGDTRIGDTRTGASDIGGKRTSASADDSTRQDTPADNNPRNAASINDTTRTGAPVDEGATTRNEASDIGDTRNGPSNLTGSRNDTPANGSTDRSNGTPTTRSTPTPGSSEQRIGSSGSPSTARASSTGGDSRTPLERTPVAQRTGQTVVEGASDSAPEVTQSLSSRSQSSSMIGDGSTSYANPLRTSTGSGQSAAVTDAPAGNTSLRTATSTTSAPADDVSFRAGSRDTEYGDTGNDLGQNGSDSLVAGNGSSPVRRDTGLGEDIPGRQESSPFAGGKDVDPLQRGTAGIGSGTGKSGERSSEISANRKTGDTPSDDRPQSAGEASEPSGSRNGSGIRSSRAGKADSASPRRPTDVPAAAGDQRGPGKGWEEISELGSDPRPLSKVAFGRGEPDAHDVVALGDESGARYVWSRSGGLTDAEGRALPKSQTLDSVLADPKITEVRVPGEPDGPSVKHAGPEDTPATTKPDAPADAEAPARDPEILRRHAAAQERAEHEQQQTKQTIEDSRKSVEAAEQTLEEAEAAHDDQRTSEARTVYEQAAADHRRTVEEAVDTLMDKAKQAGSATWKAFQDGRIGKDDAFALVRKERVSAAKAAA
ncbi:cell envelope integrity protein TolA, partial [Nocardia alni]|uniref:cell envelope integrity protein TolA n=1 Tax=Nocardia alni TaxID=2815723 RepID=UPI001C214B52